MNNKIKFILIHIVIGAAFIFPIWIGLALTTVLVFNLNLTEKQIFFATSIEFWIAIFVSIIISRYFTKRIARIYDFLPEPKETK